MKKASGSPSTGSAHEFPWLVCSLCVLRICQTACKPGSVPAVKREMAIHLGRPLPDASRDRPGRRRGSPPGPSVLRPRGLPSLLGLAPGGVCPAVAVAGNAVRSYRTISPLPPRSPGGERGSAVCFCGTFPGVAPAGRYPAPHFHGARTFLPPPCGERRPPGRLACAYKASRYGGVKPRDRVPRRRRSARAFRHRLRRHSVRRGNGAGTP